MVSSLPVLLYTNTKLTIYNEGNYLYFSFVFPSILAEKLLLDPDLYQHSIGRMRIQQSKMQIRNGYRYASGFVTLHLRIPVTVSYICNLFIYIVNQKCQV
jgi:hypothetical protein